MDFKERFKGRTTVLSKDGIVGAIQSAAIPIEKGGGSGMKEQQVLSAKKHQLGQVDVGNDLSQINARRPPLPKKESGFNMHGGGQMNEDFNILNSNLQSFGQVADRGKAVGGFLGSQAPVEIQGSPNGGKFSLRKQRSHQFDESPIINGRKEDSGQRQINSNPGPDKKMSNAQAFFLSHQKEGKASLGNGDSRDKGVLVKNSVNVLFNGFSQQDEQQYFSSPKIGQGNIPSGGLSPLSQARLNSVYSTIPVPAPIDSNVSRNSRLGNFRPYTLKDYQELVQNSKYQMGGLGPNILTEDWIKKKEKVGKMKEFADSLKFRGQDKKERIDAPVEEVVYMKERRERALENTRSAVKLLGRQQETDEQTNDSRQLQQYTNELDLLEKEHHRFRSQVERQKTKTN
eukprot:TRINITY_DN11425_c0_g1_i1.p1 TRINITY_DN11425_c0_g1~~TRINITY_DN11425_c0_g1_i1.p1  ORF type:complete len:400 (-),score=85.53 TRINITY_DN11425_c0_g1_i1:127-1326(-)